jgi:predicted transcriptional regulator
LYNSDFDDRIKKSRAIIQANILFEMKKKNIANIRDLAKQADIPKSTLYRIMAEEPLDFQQSVLVRLEFFFGMTPNTISKPIYE